MANAEPDPAAVLDAGWAEQARINAMIEGFDGSIEPDVALAATNLPMPRVNSASATRFSPATADRRIDEVIAWFDARGLPFVWRLGPLDTPTDLDRRGVHSSWSMDATSFREWLDTMVVGFGTEPGLPSSSRRR